ncbi:MAG: carbonic anhydrase [Acidobacteriota bacterium]|nr:MAG: carbonic anhydrase [Acidobacteriota bacterium]
MLNLLNGYMKFREEIYPEHRKLFESLHSGQAPETLIISCSDSRVDLNWVTQAKPGDVFYVRNAGNLVPRADRGEHAVAGAIEFAVKKLPIRDIVVCGHSDCGAMKGLKDGVAENDDSAVSGWLRLAAEQTPDASVLDLEALIRINVGRQLENLRSYPFIAERVEKRELRLWGWVYDIGSSRILQLHESNSGFRMLDFDAVT